MARADRVHANVAIAQFIGPGARERPDGRFGCAINADSREALHGGNRGVQDDRRAIVQKGKGFLNRKEETLHISVEVKIVELLVYATERRYLRDAGIRKDHVEFSTICSYGFV